MTDERDALQTPCSHPATAQTVIHLGYTHATRGCGWGIHARASKNLGAADVVSGVNHLRHTYSYMCIDG